MVQMPVSEKWQKNLSYQNIYFHYYDHLSHKQHTVFCVFLNIIADDFMWNVQVGQANVNLSS